MVWFKKCMSLRWYFTVFYSVLIQVHLFVVVRTGGLFFPSTVNVAGLSAVLCPEIPVSTLSAGPTEVLQVHRNPP